VTEEARAWQARPLEEPCPVVYPGALVVKVRDGHQVRSKAAHIAVGIDLDGARHVLGIWVQAAEGAKFQAGAGRRPGQPRRPRRADRVLRRVQTCTVHLIRSSMRFISYGDRRAVAAALRPACTAPTAESARMELEAFAASDLGRRYPATVQAWERAWDPT
jgi:putative transposase